MASNEVAESCIKQAEEALQTGFFSMRFAPDYGAAALHFKGAADAYRGSGQSGMARNCLARCCDAYCEMSDFQQAGYIFEQAAAWDVSQRKQHFEKAVAVYRKGNLLENVARLLTKICELSDDENDIGANTERYFEIVAIYEQLEKEHMSGEIYFRLVQCLEKQGNLSLLAKVLEQSSAMNLRAGNAQFVYRDLLSKGVVFLKLNNLKAVDKIISEELNTLDFVASDEFNALEQCFMAFSGDDCDRLEQVLKMPVFRFLPGPIARIAGSLSSDLQEIVKERNDHRKKPTNVEADGSSEKNGADSNEDDRENKIISRSAEENNNDLGDVASGLAGLDLS